MPLMNKNGYQNPSMCSICMSPCCTHGSGSTAPEDFGANPHLPRSENETILLPRITTALLSGKWFIDWTDEDTKPYELLLVRPQHLGQTDLIYPAFGGICIFLSSNDTGCLLPFRKRPWQCRMIEPKRVLTASCKSHVDKYDCAKTWTPYQHIIQSALKNAQQTFKHIEHNLLKKLMTGWVQSRTVEKRNHDRAEEV